MNKREPWWKCSDRSPSLVFSSLASPLIKASSILSSRCKQRHMHKIAMHMKESDIIRSRHLLFALHHSKSCCQASYLTLSDLSCS